MQTTCSTCLMDTSDPDISFNEQGSCNHCVSYQGRQTKAARMKALGPSHILSKLKRGQGSKYDCLAAISGGLDSSFTLHQLKTAGLNVLCVHIDGGWNTDEATHNIEAITRAIGFDFYVYKVNQAQFTDLQIAYLKSGVVDLEVPTDHILYAGLYEVAHRYKIRHIITGQNAASEYFMPKSWVFDKNDAVNMLAIYKAFGLGKKLDQLPLLTPWKKFLYYNICDIKFHFLLEYIEYNRQDAERILKENYGWKPYRMKHGEAVWTRYYQSYILVKRFGVDKRKAHLSNLIASGQISRTDALDQINQAVYPYPFEEDRAAILERFNMSAKELDSFMNVPKRNHLEFKNEKGLKKLYRKIASVQPLSSFLRVSPTY